MRAALELAAAEGEPVKGEKLAVVQDIPLQFLEHILLELKHARLIQARRGAKGGYWLARAPDEVTVADVTSKQLPWRLEAMLADPEVWAKR